MLEETKYYKKKKKSNEGLVIELNEKLWEKSIHNTIF